MFFSLCVCGCCVDGSLVQSGGCKSVPHQPVSSTLCFDDHVFVPTGPGLAGLLWNSRTLDIKLTPSKTCCFACNIYSETEPKLHKSLAGVLKELRFGHEYFHRFLCASVDVVLGWFCGIADILGNSDSSCGI